MLVIRFSTRKVIRVYRYQADLVTEIIRAWLVRGEAKTAYLFNDNSAFGRGYSFIHSQFEELRPREVHGENRISSYAPLTKHR